MILVCVLFFAVMVPKMQTNMDFNLEVFRYYHDYAEEYTNAADVIRSRNKYVDQAIYLAESDFEYHIQILYKIIDDHIITLKKWEEKFNTVYTEPFTEITDLISLEYVYYLLRYGHNMEDIFESGEWSSDLAWIDTNLLNYSNLRSTYKRYTTNPPIRAWVSRCDDAGIMIDYHGAELAWNILEKKANTYLENSIIPSDKKKWIANYIISNPYGNMCRKLKKKDFQYSAYLYSKIE